MNSTDTSRAHWLTLPRVPEPEVMDDSVEVAAYSSSAAQAYLSNVDDTFVARAIRLVEPLTTRAAGRCEALDIGTGPGQILYKLARRLPTWRLIGVDRSSNMIRQAMSHAAADGMSEKPDAGANGALHVSFAVADGSRLPFADASFDLVMCNSVLHHLARPAGLFAEIARVVKPSGAILVRDLRRPSRLGFAWHVRWHGRHYSGVMYNLYCDSVRAAYTPEELSQILRSAPLSGARVFVEGRTHLGFERLATSPPPL